MRLGPFRSEQRRQPQHLSRVASLPVCEVEQAEVQEQLPVIEAETNRLLILGKFLAMLSDDAVRETQMVVRERVGGIVVDNDAMAADCLGIIFHPQKVISQRIANLLVVRTAFGAGPRADRRLEYQRDQNQKTNARTATTQQLTISRVPAGRNLMLAGDRK